MNSKRAAVSASVLDEAIDWQLRLCSGDPISADDHAAFEHWLASDSQHARAWQQLSGLDKHLAAATSQATRNALVQQKRPRLSRNVNGLLLVALVSAMTLTLADRERSLPHLLADETTGRGQIRHLELTDHSQVTLGSRSALDVRFTDQERRVTLHAGEALIQTGKDPRPFFVDTEQGDLQALGTRFIVRREDDSTRLIVLESAVDAHPRKSEAHRIIAKGEQVLMRSNSLTQPTLAPLGADAWARGMIVVDDVSLQYLVDQLKPFHTGRLHVDPSIADLRITGTFPLNDADKALSALEPSLPVTVDRTIPWWTSIKGRRIP